MRTSMTPRWRATTCPVLTLQTATSSSPTQINRDWQRRWAPRSRRSSCATCRPSMVWTGSSTARRMASS
ncbi:hypothetical protein HaLaN_11769, partial [Haematococcus lacustris]